MTKYAQVDFFSENIRIRADKYGQDALTAIALRITELAKVNIVNNNQVDTGAMLNGIYAAWPGSSTFPASSPNPSGTMREATLPGNPGPKALVAGAMDYTIWQEYTKAFLYPAFVEAAKDTKTIVEVFNL